MSGFQTLWERLDEPGRQLLVTAALVPPPLSLDLLVEAGELGAVAVLQFLEEMTAAGLMSLHEPSGRGYYYFQQSGTPARILALASSSRLDRTARRLRRLLARLYPEGPRRWMALAHLHEMSGLPVGDLAQFLQAVHYCLEKDLVREADRYFRLALGSLSGARRGPGEKRALVRATLAMLEARQEAMPYPQQQEVLALARRYARQVEDWAGLARLNLVLARLHRNQGRYRPAARLFNEGWKLAGRLGDQRLLHWAALCTSEYLLWQGRVAEAIERYEEVLGDLEEFPSDQATLRSCAHLGWVYGIAGRTARGIGLIEAVRQKSRRLGLEQIRTYADLRTVLTLLEARRVEEAEPYLNDILSRPEDEVGLYILWPAKAAMAFVHWWHGDLKGAFRMQKQAFRSSRLLGMPHHRGPWNFDYLEALEEAGLVHPEMNYDAEIERLLAYPDIYMQGVALRYRAQRRLKRRGDHPRVRRDLWASYRRLERAGARLELARTQLLLAPLLHQSGNRRRARDMLEEAWRFMSVVNPKLFPRHLRPRLSGRKRDEVLVRTVAEASDTLGSVRDRDELLRRIIDLTMRLTRAERGGFFRVGEQGRLELLAGRNLDPALLAAASFQSRLEMMARVAARRREVVEEPRGRQGGWMICMPVSLRQRLLGILYLDNSLTGRSLPRDEFLLLKAITTQVAVALDNADAYREIAALRDRLEQEKRYYLEEREGSGQAGLMVGDSPAMRRVYRQIRQVAPTDTTVLITGETGVGKELVARSIHHLSPRRQGAFLPVNLASLPAPLVASELFGHERGAFTDAHQARAGRFELAQGGTLFLDDVDALTPDIQAKLLRVLQERTFERVGGSKTLKTDFRLLAATNQDLELLVSQGRFRPDFYFRLKVFPLQVPPLRRRREDIPALARHFLRIYAARLGKPTRRIDPADLERLVSYSWPGNVRELQHVIERGVILSEGERLHLPALEAPGVSPADPEPIIPLREMEKRHIRRALEACGGRVSGPAGAARLLGLKPSTLYSKIRRLDLRRGWAKD